MFSTLNCSFTVTLGTSRCLCCTWLKTRRALLGTVLHNCPVLAIQRQINANGIIQYYSVVLNVFMDKFLWTDKSGDSIKRTVALPLRRAATQPNLYGMPLGLTQYGDKTKLQNVMLVNASWFAPGSALDCLANVQQQVDEKWHILPLSWRAAPETHTTRPSWLWNLYLPNQIHVQVTAYDVYANKNQQCNRWPGQRIQNA